jgi:hypothetical protein
LIPILLVALTVAAPQLFEKRGVYYFDSHLPCPLAGIGQRGPNACNRLALDDDRTKVSIERGRIVLANSQRYDKRGGIADITLLGTGKTKSGATVPIAVHLKVDKHHDDFSGAVHAHLPVDEEIVSTDFDTYEVIATRDDGKSTIVLDQATAIKAVREPRLMAKLANALVEVRDNGTKDALADISIGIGAGALAKMVVRAQLVPSHVENVHTLADLFHAGAWELRLSSLSDLLPKDVLRRDLFLFGVDQLPVVAEIEKNGLKKGQTLVFAMHDGQGSLGVGQKVDPLPDAVDVARAYLEFSFIGGILAYQVEHRLK